jgi:hypothetical protein
MDVMLIGNLIGLRLVFGLAAAAQALVPQAPSGYTSLGRDACGSSPFLAYFCAAERLSHQRADDGWATLPRPSAARALSDGLGDCGIA